MPFLMKSIREKYFRNAEYNIHLSDYFTAKNQKTGFLNITENTYAIHHFAGSWIPEKNKKAGVDQWSFFEKYGEDEFLVNLFNQLENKSPNRISLKKLYKIVATRTIKKLLGKKIWRLTRNIRLKIQYDI
jgi:hypothetical protein